MSKLITVRGAIRVSGAGNVRAEFARRSGCGGCRQSAVCGTRLLGAGSGRKLASISLQTANTVDGTSVEATIGASTLLGMTLACYLLPAALVVIGAWLATLVLPWQADLAALCGVIFGLIGAGALMRAIGPDGAAHSNVSIGRLSGYNS